MRYTGPACRLCRREGEKLFLKGEKCTSQKCPLLKKNYAPGHKGNKSGFGKQSEYGRQLRNKQKAKRMYGVAEKPFRRYYGIATKQEGITGENLLRILEQRLDNVVYRSGLADSRAQARQFVSHGLIKLNNKKAKTPSQLVKIGDKIAINAKDGVQAFDGVEKKKDTSPKWLKVDLKKGESEVAFLPEKDDFEGSIDSQMIVEFYSK
ncbi:30S ribosomal protein S4 [Candidatus Peregrinibacteria bacterium]|jgi:small subunit ribosomal protein S4|nr:30S ribosomal protein S4 [Candidatus Peregrinibacteria bacterium]MBT4055912.1 30S ribosomal protein S4 [Candidatus Peregrinibacteria bacterium]